MHCLCLFMIVLGMHSCFYHAFLSEDNLLPWGCLLLPASFWFGFLCLKLRKFTEEKGLKKGSSRKYIVLFLMLWGATMIGVLLFMLWKREHFIYDAQVIYDAVKYRYDVYFHLDTEPVRIGSGKYHGVTGSWLIFALELLLTAFMTIAFSGRKGEFFGILPPIALVAGCMLLGQTPYITDLILIVCGVLGFQIMQEPVSGRNPSNFRQRPVPGEEPVGWLRYFIMLCLVVVVCWFGSALSVSTKSVALSGEEYLLQKQHALERAATDLGVQIIQKLESLFGVEHPGLMTNMSPAFTGKTVLTITTDEKPDTDMYLRGFVGTKYKDGKWTIKDQQDLTELFSQDECYQLLTQDYDFMTLYRANLEHNALSSQVQGSGAAVSRDESKQWVGEVEESEKVSMTIEYAKNNRSTYVYMPYYSKLNNDSMGSLMLNNDKGFRRGSDVDSYTIDTLRNSGSTAPVMEASTDILRKGMVPCYSIDGNLSSLKGQDGLFSLENSGPLKIFWLGQEDAYRTTTVSAEGGKSAPSIGKEEEIVPITNEKLGTYFQYVMSEDLWLPNTGLDRTKELANKLVRDDRVNLRLADEDWASVSAAAGEGEKATVNSIITQMQRYFADNTVYSQSLQRKKLGVDYVENFLFEQKKGYCEHYATAGAVLFRAMGVPARYVSGYKVPLSAFKENEDGTYTAKVLDSQGHAWTEVYTTNAGWMVADMTPSSSQSSGGTGTGGQGGTSGEEGPNGIPTEDPDFGDDAFLKSSSTPESTEDVSAEEEETATPDALDSVNGEDDEMEPESSDGETADDSSEVSDADTANGDERDSLKNELIKRFIKILPWVVAVCVILTIILILWSGQGRRRKKRLKKCDGPGSYLLERNRQLAQYLKECGYEEVGHLDDREYVRFLGQIHPQGKKELQEYYKLLEKARFSQEMPDQADVRRMNRLLRRVERKALKNQKLWRKIYVRVIRNWK